MSVKQDSAINQITAELLATMRAMTNDANLQLSFDVEKQNNFFSWSGDLSYENHTSLPEIKIYGDSEEEKNIALKKSRASADMAACYFLFHNKKVFAHDLQKYTSSAKEEKIFIELEKIRLIANANNSYLGVTKNILEKIESDIKGEAVEPEQGLALALLDGILPHKILSQSKKLAQTFKDNLSQKSQQQLTKITKNIGDQSAFALELAELLKLMQDEVKNEKQDSKSEGSDQKTQPKSPQKNDDSHNFGAENTEKEIDDSLTESSLEENVKNEESQPQKIEVTPEDVKGSKRVNFDKSEIEENKIEFQRAYKIFTNKFDEIIFPQKLVKKNELETLRDQLDLRLLKLNKISKRMTLRLKKKLLSKRSAFLDYDASRGILNRKKLVNLVLDPTLEDVWVNTFEHEYQDTALTILLDNSGSMRGNPIVMSAMACEIIAQILEKFSIKTEIIGFTTADWKGGRPRKLWESSGKPKNPGRLNELRHIIYKPFGQKLKKARVNLGLMLKEGILKENIDGEALLFAHSRLSKQKEKRKILLVISDGTPVDDSTTSSNDNDILSEHLRRVIHRIENTRQPGKKVEIVGIGIGHTTEDFYRNSITIRNIEELGDVMINKIAELL